MQPWLNLLLPPAAGWTLPSSGSAPRASFRRTVWPKDVAPVACQAVPNHLGHASWLEACTVLKPGNTSFPSYQIEALRFNHWATDQTPTAHSLAFMKPAQLGSSAEGRNTVVNICFVHTHPFHLPSLPTVSGIPPTANVLFLFGIPASPLQSKAFSNSHHPWICVTQRFSMCLASQCRLLATARCLRERWKVAVYVWSQWYLMWDRL